MRWTIIASLMLTGCATSLQHKGEVRTVHLVCGGATRVDINLDGRTAVLHDTNGEKLILERSNLPWGTRYEGGGASILRSENLYVYYARDGAVLTCSPLSR